MFNHEDGSCTECDGHAIIRTNSKTGDSFYGCTNFPRCKNTQSLRSNRFSGDGFFSSDQELECWAEAMTYDCGWK